MQGLKRIPRTVSNAHQYRQSARAMSSTTVPSSSNEDRPAASFTATHCGSASNTHRSGWARYQTIVAPTVPTTTTFTGALRFPSTRGVSRSYFSTKKDEDNEKSDSKKSSGGGGGPRLEARFGKLGAFVDRLTDEVGEELKKNKDIQEGLDELNKLKDDTMKPLDSFRDQKVGGKSVDEQAAAATEKAKEAAEMAEKGVEEAKVRAEQLRQKGEDVSDQLREKSEKISNLFGNLKEKVTDKASEQYESSEYAQSANEKYKEAKKDVAKTSWFASLSSAVSETLQEAKEDLLGESARGTDGRRRQPRRRVKPHEAAWRQKLSNLENTVAGEGGEEGESGKGTKSGGGNDGGEEENTGAEEAVLEPTSDWSSAVDPETGDTYYYNTLTGETSWDKPDEDEGGQGDGAVGEEGGDGTDGTTETNHREGAEEDTTEGEEDAKDYTGNTGGVEVVQDKESSWEQVKEFLTKTPIIQDILGASSQQARRFGKTDAGKAARKRMRKAGNKIEDAREIWETSQNPYIYQMASAYDAVFAETEEGQAVKELRRLDRDFVLEEWLLDVEDDFAPDMLQAYLTGDESLMKGMCGDTTKAMVSASLAERKKNGFVMDSTILDIRGTCFNSSWCVGGVVWCSGV